MAEILLGDVNPSGKLPVTFEKKWEDNPVHDSYYYPGYPGPSGLHDSKHVKFTEGIFVGYRGYDKNSTGEQTVTITYAQPSREACKALWRYARCNGNTGKRYHGIMAILS